MSGSPSNTKVAAAVVETVEAKNVETVTTTTTVVTTVEETVATLELASESSSAAVAAIAPLLLRDLPIFGNPQLANATIIASGALAQPKPKTGRVKATANTSGKGSTVPVLKITAPKAEGNGEVVVMRRMDSDLVNATAMFNAAYPSISESMEEKEMSYLAEKYEAEGAIVEKAGSGALAGVWVTLVQAKELAKEYGIDQFMHSLLEAPARKNTTKAAASSAAVSNPAVVTAETATTEEKEQEQEEEDQQSILETVVLTTEEEVFVKETIETDEVKVEKSVQDKEEEEVPAVENVVMKRRIEELEEEATRDRKRYRGFVAAAAVGLVAVAALPQVLPYFS